MPITTAEYASFQGRRDTTANWQSENPILAAAECGYISESLGQATVLYKIGDGVTPWNDLPLLRGTDVMLSDDVDLDDSERAASSRAVKTVNDNLGQAVETVNDNLEQKANKIPSGHWEYRPIEKDEMDRFSLEIGDTLRFDSDPLLVAPDPGDSAETGFYAAFQGYDHAGFGWFFSAGSPRTVTFGFATFNNDTGEITIEEALTPTLANGKYYVVLTQGIQNVTWGKTSSVNSIDLDVDDIRINTFVPSFLDLSDEQTRAIEAEAALRGEITDINLALADVAGIADSNVLADAALVEEDGVLSLSLTTVDTASGEETVVKRAFPIASAQQPGLMSSADVAALTDLATAVESLSGRGVRYPVHLDGVEISQANLQDAYETASGNTGAPVDGATLVDLDSNTAYTWYESSATWVTRGSDTVSMAANGVLGVVKGDAEETPGKVYVESDGSMSVIGWDERNQDVETGVLPSQAITWTAAQRGAITTLTSAATITPDFSLSNNFEVTLNVNATLANPTNVVAGQSGVITVTQGTTARTLAFGSYYKFSSGVAPALTATANAVDSLAYYVDSATRIVVSLLSNVK